jgi:CHAT domain-containing protein
VIPHGTLHQLPFAALHDGERYLVDRWPVSVAPSASVWTLAMRRPASRGRGDLVLGVTDDAAPWSRRTAEAVAHELPGAAVFLGDAASAGVLRTTGAGHRRIHLSVPAMHRRDNPLFSAIPFPDQPLSVFDLYRLRLDADLVSVSGCGAGLGMVASGDELVGLTHGLLYAGARSTLLSLWDVHDDGAAVMSADVYRRLADDPHPARALRDAMLARRRRDPHPFYWAAMVLAGASTPPVADATR